MLSIVIPAYNEEKTILQCLDSLANQETHQKFEVIVINNNSTDKTEEVAKRYKNKLNLKIILEKRKGRGWARYTGFKVAKGEIIFSTDADTVVPENWIEEMTSYFKDKNILAVTGPAKINDCSWLTNRLYNLFEPIVVIMCKIIFGSFLLTGFNSAVRKRAYLKSGGFNPKINGLEDVDLGFKLGKMGKVKFVRKPTVIISGRRFKKSLIRGTLPYIKTFTEYSLSKKEAVSLKDIR